MAKKITFLLVLLLGLFLASVTAFADNPNTTALDNTVIPQSDIAISDIGSVLPENDGLTLPGTGLNNEEALADIKPGTEMIDYTEKYADLFLNPESASTSSLFVNIKKWNHNDLSINPLSYVLTGSVIPNADDPSDSPVVVLFYIKENGKYVPLYLIDNKKEKSNMLEKDTTIVSYVDLLNLGSDKTNDIRIVAFREDDAENLVLGENLQITDIPITVRKNIIEGVPFILNIVMNALELK